MAENLSLNPNYEQFELLINGLIDNEYGSVDSFFKQETITGLRNTLLKHFCKGAMHPAGIGRNFDYQKNLTVRGDLIKWLSPNSGNVYEQLFFEKISQFTAHLNQTCYTGINDFEFHYALYDVGSFYKKHLDQFKSDKGRKFSFILYLNEDWEKEEGGNLTLYLKDKCSSIYPIENRIVFFASDKLEHEVHPSFKRPRMSIAGWLKTV